MNDLIKRELIGQALEHRARALELYERGFGLLKAAEELHRAAALGGTISGCPGNLGVSYGCPKKFRARMRKEVDRNLWLGLIEKSQIGTLMDASTKAKFRESLKDDPPEATYENVIGTLTGLIGNSDKIFREGLVKAFLNLDTSYASNDSFTIGRRLVVERAVECYGRGYWSLHTRANDEIQDVDRVMYILDGKPAPESDEGIAALIKDTMKREGGVRRVVDGYWDARWFKKGTLHLYPLRRDLVKKANRLIAEHYGETLPGSRDER